MQECSGILKVPSCQENFQWMTKRTKSNVAENWSTGSDLLLIYTFIEFIYSLYWLDDFVQYVPSIKYFFGTQSKVDEI